MKTKFELLQAATLEAVRRLDPNSPADVDALLQASGFAIQQHYNCETASITHEERDALLCLDTAFNGAGDIELAEMKHEDLVLIAKLFGIAETSPLVFVTSIRMLCPSELEDAKDAATRREMERLGHGIEGDASQ